MLPEDLLHSLYRICGQVSIEWYTRYEPATEVTDHVIDSLELFLQVIGVPATSLRRLILVYWFTGNTSVGKKENNVFIIVYTLKVNHVYPLTLKAPITTAADDKFCDIFLNF